MSGMIELRLLCEQMRALETRKEELESLLKQVNSDLDFVRLRKIPELMQTLEVRNATFEGLGRVQLASDLHANTREGKKDAAMTWLRDLGYEGMISETYNASTLKALFRRMLTEGKPIPEEIFNVTPFIRASIVKG
jgi:hypothetical protein